LTRRRPLVIAAGAAVAAQWAPAVAAVLPRAAALLGIPTRLASDGGVLLTFDDGPHPLGTPAVLAALDRHRAPAVFFVSGEQAERHPQLVREIAAAGHELALHGHRHQYRRQISRRLLAADLRRAVEAVSAAVDGPFRLHRPPYGVYTLSGLRLVRSVGLEPLLWSKWGLDWRRSATSSSIARRVTAGIRAGDILLLHDADHYSTPGSWRATAGALPEIFERIEAAGLVPASVRAQGPLALTG